jgi:hypothetical protein
MNLNKLGFEKKRTDDLIAGGTAGALANLVVAPIDAIADSRRAGTFLGHKLMSKTIPAQIKEMYYIGGPKGFFSGAGVKMLKVAPASALSFALYGITKDILQRKNK